jgi:hypothetical protein
MVDLSAYSVFVAAPSPCVAVCGHRACAHRHLLLYVTSLLIINLCMCLSCRVFNPS